MCGSLVNVAFISLRTGASQPSIAPSASRPVVPVGTPQRTSPDTPRGSRVNGSSNNVTTAAINDVLRRQMAGDIRNRGPPPQPPTPRNGIQVRG